MKQNLNFPQVTLDFLVKTVLKGFIEILKDHSVASVFLVIATVMQTHVIAIQEFVKIANIIQWVIIAINVLKDITVMPLSTAQHMTHA